ncbi:MAG: C-terminal binding protein [Acidobacteriota bacterium]
MMNTAGSRASSTPIVAIVDRHAWYDPAIEAGELARVAAKPVVSWAGIPDRPPQTNHGFPSGGLSREALSRITSAFVSPSITTEDRVIEMAGSAAGILVVRANISAHVMDALPRLQVIGRYGVGVDNIDTAAADERGIAVVYAPDFCTREVADHTLMLLLACSRKLEPLHRAMTMNTWGRDAASPMRALFGQTLGLVGFGRIAREVAARAKAFGMDVIACDPFLADRDLQRLGAAPVPIADLLARSDFISLHLPLTAGTHHLIGQKELDRMKRSAFLINTSRGPLVDEDALAAALERDRIAGAALDVFEVEPLPSTSPLRRLQNVLMTPHTGGLSDEAQIRARRMVAAAMADVLCGTWPAGPELYCPRDEAGRERARRRSFALGSAVPR